MMCCYVHGYRAELIDVKYDDIFHDLIAIWDSANSEYQIIHIYRVAPYQSAMIMLFIYPNNALSSCLRLFVR